MQDLDEEVPEFARSIVGHICGIIFIFLSAFCLWSLYRYSLNSNHLILIIVGISFGIAWFFGATAFKLTLGSPKSIITNFWRHAVAVFVVIFSFLNVAGLATYILTKDVDYRMLAAWFAFSILLTFVCSGYIAYLKKIR